MAGSLPNYSDHLIYVPSRCYSHFTYIPNQDFFEVPDDVVAYNSSRRLTPSYILGLYCLNLLNASGVSRLLWQARSQRSFNSTSTNYSLNDDNCEVSYVSPCIVGSEVQRARVEEAMLDHKMRSARKLRSCTWVSTSQLYSDVQ